MHSALDPALREGGFVSEIKVTRVFVPQGGLWVVFLYSRRNDLEKDRLYSDMTYNVVHE
jgi:hypothetical protein